jgi:hypothetical protein
MAIEVVEVSNAVRPSAPPSRLDTEAFHLIEATHRRIYDAATIRSHHRRPNSARHAGFDQI